MAVNRKKSEIHRKKRKQKGLIFIIALFLGLSVLLSFFFGDTGLMGFLRVNQEHNQLTQDIEYFLEQNDRLRKEVKALQYDTQYIESIARDRLGMIHKGDLVYQFEKNSPKPD